MSTIDGSGGGRQPDDLNISKQPGDKEAPVEKKKGKGVSKKESDPS